MGAVQVADDSRLPAGVRDLIRAPENEVFVSTVTGWEIAISKALGTLEAPDDLVTLMDDEGFEALPICVADGQSRANFRPFIVTHSLGCLWPNV